MILYRLKSRLDGEYYKSEIKYRLEYPASMIWRTKYSLREFFLNRSVGHLQLINNVYNIERQNTRTGKLVVLNIVKFLNFFGS